MDLTVNPKERCFLGNNFPPEQAYNASATEEPTKRSFQVDILVELPPYKVVKN